MSIKLSRNPLVVITLTASNNSLAVFAKVLKCVGFKVFTELGELAVSQNCINFLRYKNNKSTISTNHSDEVINRESEKAAEEIASKVHAISSQGDNSKLLAIPIKSITPLLPPLISILSKNEIEFKVIYLLRHPWEVAMELKKLNFKTLEEGHLEWLRTYQEFIKIQSMYNVPLIIKHNQLFDEPIDVLYDLNKELALGLSFDKLKDKCKDFGNKAKRNNKDLSYKKMNAEDQQLFSVFNRLYENIAKQDKDRGIDYFDNVGRFYSENGQVLKAEELFRKSFQKRIDQLEAGIGAISNSKLKKITIDNSFEIALYKRVLSKPLYEIKSLNELIKPQYIMGEFTRYDVLIRACLINYLEKDKDFFIKNYCAMQKVRVRNFNVDNFIQLVSSFRSRGFMEEYPIPVSLYDQIIDGSHRLSCALYFGINEVPTIIVPYEQDIINYGRKWFLDHSYNMSLIKEADALLEQLI